MLKLLHGADFHLDSPFAGLTPEAAQARRRLQRRLPLELAALCKREKCDLVLLAGDLFDSGRVTPESVEALQQGLEADRKSTRLNSSHRLTSRMPSSA